ncbi:MAG: hypothetical protein KVP17_004628 [Porospora cf. gigantea B]|uniref:uncharacterized protein n=1 Tax=Porospora cf. gigantea B TaxID=2853592 RepID=UPI003571ADEB|nr:MAG: hypothetical protein KVP17_004628 [Porospora cf. gigantea B]
MKKRQRDSESSDSTEKPSKKVKTSHEELQKDQGVWDDEKKAFVWRLGPDLVLCVSKFRGKVSVDVRHQWEGRPTKKGIHISPEIFRDLQAWSSLDFAVEKANEQ